jgi:hypothetical protein
MASDPRVQELLEELLESGDTPEEVCRHSPEMLPEVIERWQRLHACDAQLDAWFPEERCIDRLVLESVCSLRTRGEADGWMGPGSESLGPGAGPDGRGGHRCLFAVSTGISGPTLGAFGLTTLLTVVSRLLFKGDSMPPSPGG